MKWRQENLHYAVSDCGFYTVSKCRGIDGEPLYSAWYRIAGAPSSKSGKVPLLLACTGIFKLASEACRKHQSLSTQHTPQPAAEEIA